MCEEPSTRLRNTRFGKCSVVMKLRLLEFNEQTKALPGALEIVFSCGLRPRVKAFASDSVRSLFNHLNCD